MAQNFQVPMHAGVAAQLNQLVMQERLKAATALLGELAAARDGFNTLDLQIFDSSLKGMSLSADYEHYTWSHP